MSEGTNDGIKLLVERLKTHPEEFGEGGHYRWNNILNDVVHADYLTKEEKDLVFAEMRQVNRSNFTRKVMDALLNQDEATEMMKIKAQGRYLIDKGTISGTTISTSQFNGTSLSELVDRKLAALKHELTQPSPFGAVPKEK